MRYCPHCHRLNTGRPQICNYCSRTWHVRLCPARHENPPDAIFCGTCGSADLTETSGPLPLWIGLIKIGILIIILFMLFSLRHVQFTLNDQAVNTIIAILILVTGLHIASSYIPSPAKKLVWMMVRILKNVAIWSWEKIKNFIN